MQISIAFLRMLTAKKDGNFPNLEYVFSFKKLSYILGGYYLTTGEY